MKSIQAIEHFEMLHSMESNPILWFHETLNGLLRNVQELSSGLGHPDLLTLYGSKAAVDITELIIDSLNLCIEITEIYNDVLSKPENPNEYLESLLAALRQQSIQTMKIYATHLPTDDVLRKVSTTIISLESEKLESVFCSKRFGAWKEALLDYLPKIQLTKSLAPRIEEILPDNKLKSEFKSLSDIFKKPHTPFLLLLTKSEPPLFEQHPSGAFEFIGQKKGHSGCVAAYFKLLKSKGIINQNANRSIIAAIISSEIINLSITGASIDNLSQLYRDDFEHQFQTLLKSMI